MIDWTIFDKWPEDTYTCFDCGSSFRSHGRYSAEDNAVVSRKPCPKCGGRKLSGLRSDPETFTIER